MRTASAQEAVKSLAEGGGRLIDVRELEEFRSQHIAGSCLMPLSLLETQARCLNRSETIYLVCHSGIRSGMAAEFLSREGFSSVWAVEGGVESMAQAGARVERSASVVWSMERQVRGAAGALVLAGVLLSLAAGRGWLALSGFVGAGLVFSAVTGTCGLALLLARMPWNRRS